MLVTKLMLSAEKEIGPDKVPCLRNVDAIWLITSPADMRFVKKFTPPDFQAKNFTHLFLLNYNSIGDKNTKKLVKMETFTLLAKILHCRWQ